MHACMVEPRRPRARDNNLQECVVSRALGWAAEGEEGEGVGVDTVPRLVESGHGNGTRVVSRALGC